ncbi:hypothetical protein SAMN05428981_103295 [Bacillus sp. OV194]|nr:hypothetical protein SAMN05428981_103295 [Bacillus sp. OV194]
MLKIWLPAAGEHLAYSTSQIAITYFITLLGTDALTTKVYALNIMMFIFLFSVSIGEGTQIIDAKFPALMGVISMWGISVPLAYFLGIAMEMGLLGIWIAFIVDEWLRGLLMLWRWRSRIWERKNVLDIQPGAAHT